MSYLQKWTTLKEKGLYPSEIQEVELHGKLFGKRKVSLASKSFRDLRITMGSYAGIYPFQEYHFIYKDNRTGGEIDRARRLEIEIR